MGKTIFAFVSGVAIGSVATYFVMRRWTDEYVNNEVAAFKEDWNRVHPDEHKVEKTVDKSAKETAPTPANEDVSSIMSYAKTIKESNYAPVEYSNAFQKTPEKKPDEIPYAISEDEYGAYYDYEKVTLVFYEDGILADEDNEIVYPPNTVGEDFESYFTESEADTIYIRNDSRKCDYMIYRDYRTFSMVIDDGSFRNDDE